jgi:hypothetical protein
MFSTDRIPIVKMGEGWRSRKAQARSVINNDGSASPRPSCRWLRCSRDNQQADDQHQRNKCEDTYGPEGGVGASVARRAVVLLPRYCREM